MTGLANSTNFAYFFYQGNTSGQNWSAGGHVGFRLASGNVGWVKLTPRSPPDRRIRLRRHGRAHQCRSHDPEPGTLFTLALGTAGLLAWRAHRQKQAKKTKNAENTTEEAG